MKQFQIYVTGKEGVFDPAGEQAKGALVNLGFEGVSGVRIGKFIELEVADEVTEDQVRNMCEKLLANPVIEDYIIKNA